MKQLITILFIVLSVKAFSYERPTDTLYTLDYKQVFAIVNYEISIHIMPIAMLVGDILLTYLPNINPLANMLLEVDYVLLIKVLRVKKLFKIA